VVNRYNEESFRTEKDNAAADGKGVKTMRDKETKRWEREGESSRRLFKKDRGLEEGGREVGRTTLTNEGDRRDGSWGKRSRKYL